MPEQRVCDGCGKLYKSRQVEWQQANRGRYNAKMREYMRKRRADV